MLDTLPPELLHEIVDFLDNNELLQLGLTCRSTHVIALSTFFKRNDIREPGDGWLVAYKTPPETLAAIHAADWVKNLRQIHYYLNPGVDRLMSEARDLNRLVRSLPKIEIVKLHFSVVDSWASGHRENLLNRMEWAREFTSVLDSFIDRGCNEMYVSGGGAIRALYSEEEPFELPDFELMTSSSKSTFIDPIDTSSNHSSQEQATPMQESDTFEDNQPLSAPDQGSSQVDLHLNQSQNLTNTWKILSSPVRFGYNFIRRLLGIATPAANSHTLPTSRKSSSTFSFVDNAIISPNVPKELDGLRELHLHSDMLLQNTFYPWTIQTLNKAAPTLTCLSFKWADTSTATWTTLFASCTLPRLESFEITTDLVVCKDSASFMDLVNFFRRHSTIRRILLQGVERPSDPQAIDEPILPQLAHIMAHPTWISSLLAMVETFPGALADLDAIGISTEYYQHGRFDYDFVDIALEKLANLHRTGITLTLRFMCQSGVQEWFADHVALGRQGGVIPRLTCVSCFVISTSFFVNFRPQTVEQFPQWLALFPCLIGVKFVEMPEEQYDLFNNPGFLKALVALCPDIIAMEVGRSTCDLVGAKEMNVNPAGSLTAVDALD
ncbi:hypothetical protein CPB83DRAFT_809545 [Crepidotus variabilis]|uniref:F-box domain-containing protein n=1 Tax=Crepidotus variabilis TaxID=179855 RepID=A0A9P6JRT3_9AGAR|nr:hypothetical protein CPB83DRAFT_809545 [Crepidotus variabilis]